jgi:hypothetical protein
MDLSSVSNTFISSSTQAPQRAPEAAEVKKPVPDGNGDAGNGGGTKAVQPPAALAVNTNGEKIGQVVNVTA